MWFLFHFPDRHAKFRNMVEKADRIIIAAFAGLCFKLLPCAFAQKTNGLSSCFYLPRRALSCFQLRRAFGKNLATFF